MGEFYHELVLRPSSYSELFVDFIIDATGEAVEEIDDSIVVRSERELLWLVGDLERFSQELSKRLDEPVSFAHALSQKRNEDWIARYRESVQPVACGAFYIRPSWHLPNPDLIDIQIDPALAFGSGHHGTTSGCLQLLSALELAGKRALDVGCGSGILSIAALKKGAEVEICDTDELAIGESLKNATLNGVNPKHSWVGSIGEATGEYDLITANILAAILIILAPQLQSKLKSGGTLILSGILEEYRESVLQKFSALALTEEITQEGWVTLQLHKD